MTTPPTLERFVTRIEVSLRLAHEEDLPWLEWFGWFTRHRAIIRDAYERHRRGENVMLLAIAADFPIGQVWIDLGRKRHEGGALLWAVRVLPGFQRAGIGERLVRRAEALAAERGATRVELGVEKDNPGARRFYERLGYAVAGEVHEHYECVTPDGREEHTDMDEWVMHKRLPPSPVLPSPRGYRTRPTTHKLAVRWTLGDVSRFGFDALRLSIWGARRLFGDDATYTVCVNSISVEQAQALTGDVPPGIRWRDVSRELSNVVAPHLDHGMAEGVGWKFAPLRLHRDCHELALDNDCILWETPPVMREWLARQRVCLVAEDVRPGFGQFASFCGDAPRNLGIRGVPPGFDLEAAIRRMLERHPVTLTSELDEQGLQVAALSQDGAPLVVHTSDVTICSPFPPHQPELGRCGAHFVGLNAKRLPWSRDGREASEYVADHWRRHRGAICERLGLPPES